MAAIARGGMRLDLATWQEVETYLRTSGGIIIPTGSTEQHGPMSLIGTDAICAEEIAEGVAELAGAMVAPTLAYTPAPFNTAALSLKQRKPPWPTTIWTCLQATRAGVNARRLAA